MPYNVTVGPKRSKFAFDDCRLSKVLLRYS